MDYWWLLLALPAIALYAFVEYLLGRAVGHVAVEAFIFGAGKLKFFRPNSEQLQTAVANTDFIEKNNGRFFGTVVFNGEQWRAIAKLRGIKAPRNGESVRVKYIVGKTLYVEPNT